MGREAKINNKLTRKQTVFVRELAEGKSGTQAALVAYDVEDSKTASVIASQNLNKLNIHEALEEALRSNGLSISVITGNIGNLANSKPEKVSGDTVLKANIELAKLLNLYPGSKHARLNVNIRSQLKDLSWEELKVEHAKIDAELKELMAEDTPVYTQTNLE